MTGKTGYLIWWICTAVAVVVVLKLVFGFIWWIALPISIIGALGVFAFWPVDTSK